MPSFRLPCAIALCSLALMPPARAQETKSSDADGALAATILNDQSLLDMQIQARELLRSGLTAGSFYTQVWIRDLDTFIEAALDVQDPKKIREALLLIAAYQGADGNVADGYAPVGQTDSAGIHRTIPSHPELVGHKNTAAVDQETSLVQAVGRYVRITGDAAILREPVEGKALLARLEAALQFLMDQRFDTSRHLLWGATRMDWGDVQPEDTTAVMLNAHSHRSACVYDNAMFLMALDTFVGLPGVTDEQKAHWQQVRTEVAASVRRYLWDAPHGKFIPHVYLDGSPFPADFDENALYYHGGTAVGIEAGLLSDEEISRCNRQMVRNAQDCGAATVGLAVYPPYPAGYFNLPSMRPYGYQNGGDWSWFGGRMVQQLAAHGLVREAYDELKPMVQQTQDHHGFFEYFDLYNQPQGAKEYRGTAGVLYQAVATLRDWAKEHASGGTAPAKSSR